MRFNLRRARSRFSNGDKITVLEVRGTAPTFEPGNKYRIKGTYTLRSRDGAKLSAYVTTKDDALVPNDRNQTQIVERGDDSFTLILPMFSDGWPHVSFYPVGGGEGFGGIYFGTGDSVLKDWERSTEECQRCENKTSRHRRLVEHVR